jgi:mycothiol synthase
MRRPDLKDLPDPMLPLGYKLRVADPQDSDNLAAVLSTSFEEPWSPELAYQRFFEDPTVQRTFLIEHDGEAVATASSQLLPDRFPGSGVVHWVGASPAHAGKGLGVAVCLAVLHDHRDRGCMDSVLTTDDHRLAAIKSYLKLGFEPVMSHESHPERWEAVLRSLGQRIKGG